LTRRANFITRQKPKDMLSDSDLKTIFSWSWALGLVVDSGAFELGLDLDSNELV